MIPAVWADRECCDLVTTGRVTGREHRIEIWFGIVGNRVCLISGHGDRAHWFRNLLADPRVRLVFDDVEFEARATVVIDPDDRRHIGEVMRRKYDWEGDPDIGLTYDAWCFDVPAVWLDAT